MGDFVLLATWAGPYTVVKTISNCEYHVEHLVHGGKETAHISKLRLYSYASVGITQEIKDHIGFEENQEHLVSKILQGRKRKSIWEFLVAWKGFDEESWGMHRYFILMYLIWFKTLFFLMHLLAERKLLQSFLIFKNEPQV